MAKNKYLWVILLVIIIFGLLIADYFPNENLKDWLYVNDPLHSAVEAIGSTAAVFMGIVLLQKKNSDKGDIFYILALGFFGMGIIDGFHAIVHTGNRFVFLHSIAGLIGGALFSLIWLPKIRKTFIYKDWFIYVFISAIILFGLNLTVFPEISPRMISAGKFLPLAININLLAGAFFVFSGIRIVSLYMNATENASELYLFAFLTTLFGGSALAFNYSSVWDFYWWMWHILRLIAYLLSLGFVMRQYQVMRNSLMLAYENLQIAQGDTQNALKELEHSQQLLQQKNYALETSNQELEQFAYIASHDLQEPLRMISSYLQLIQRRYTDKLDESGNEFIEYAVDGAVRMKRLINDLLAFSRVGTRGSEFKEVDLNELFKTMEHDLQFTIQENYAKINYSDFQPIIADPGQLGQLFENLIKNAIKFRKEISPQIDISMEFIEAKNLDEKQIPCCPTSPILSDCWLFKVRDNGIGIAPEYSERIFKIFQRLHSQNEYSGTGIGLAISKRIVERHKGSIWVDSTAGEGATFYFTIDANLSNNEDKEQS